MINKDRVRTMTRLAIYEEGQGVADDKMNGYFKNDYIVGHMVGSFVSGTIACLLIVFVYCCYYAFMIFFLAVSFFVYFWRYNATKGRIERYNRRLNHLKDSYEKEDKHADNRI